MPNPQVKEIEKLLGGPSRNAEILARYVGARIPEKRKKDEQSSLVYWGLAVPLHRAVAKKKLSFSHLSDEDQWPHWIKIWNESEIFDVKSVALVWLSHPKRMELRKKKYKDLFKIAGQIDNWAHSDGLSSMLAEILEANPKLLSVYKKWNVSKNPWLRRQSLVGVYCYARLRKKHIPATQSLKLVKARLSDPHFYVQRAVGWTLREIDRVDSKKQRTFVQQHLNNISPVAWFATSELYPVQLRKQLVARRKTRSKA